MLKISVNINLCVRCLVISNPHFRMFLRNKSSIAAGGTADALDGFVDNLMITKVNKWRSRRKIVQCDTFKKSISDCDVQLEEPILITHSTVDECIMKNFNSPKLTSILRNCLDKKLCPSKDLLLKLAQNFANVGNAEYIDVLISLHKVGHQIELNELEVYRILRAEAMWRSGESSEKSLNILWEIYKEQPALRRYVRSSLRVLISEVVLNRGEASLIQAKNFVLQIASPPYEDYLPLSYFWARCILSDCYADHQLAAELAEECKERELFKRALGSRIHSVIGEALSRHQIDAIHRLLETFLKLSMDNCSQHVLEKLFDYKYLLADVEGCDAVLEACSALGLDVGYTRRKELEKLRANKSSKFSFYHQKKEQKQKSDLKYKQVPKFKLKL
ncbi:hypothetical protein J437_LFUL000508 [Ladona fulva]|uniref:Uncharacterized protein n=1 Tax=Ladona fulva TaxID=123851 RepID=A0A8K0NWA9_LADFU|nr:hypothetical protein J437_LFUL000508 [Ladona fulva]